MTVASKEEGALAWSGLRNVVGILSIPRSGTTVLTAALAANQEVAAVYEPLNADPSEKWRAGEMSFERLLLDYKVDLTSRSAVVLKETSARFESMELFRKIFKSIPLPLDRSLLVILRNPFHCFLSLVQGRREWWGQPDFEITPESFDAWAQRTLTGISKILRILTDVGGYCVSYAALVRKPADLQIVYEACGLSFSGNELAFHESVNLRQARGVSKVRGDRSFEENPRPLNIDSEQRRDEQMRALLEEIAGAQLLSRIHQVRECVEKLDASVVHPANHASVQALLACCTPPKP